MTKHITAGRIQRIGFVVLPVLLPLVLISLLLRFTQSVSIAETAVPVVASAEDLWVSVIIEFPGRADLTNLPAEKESRHTTVIQRLKSVAGASQASLLPELERLQADGRVLHYRPFWIVNAIAVTADQATIDELATRPDIRRIVPDEIIEADLPETVPAGSPSDLTWGLNRIRAQQTWAGLGVDGSGIVIANMDTGVDWSHPDLASNYRGQGTGMHNGHWLDVTENAYATPTDVNGHGTHVMGTTVGQNGIGVAPGAEWIAVRIFNDGNFATTSGIHSAFEWLLAPAGDSSLAPDVVNGSWGSSIPTPVFSDVMGILVSVGIIPVFSAGNNGPDGTVGSPGSYADVIAVGASDSREEVAWFSSIGPSTFTSQNKPTLVAPGARVLSAIPGGGYGFKNGTSMAAPHVAGTTALLLSADPTLDRASLTAVLTDTAITVNFNEPTIPNNVSGWGRVDAYKAVASVVNNSGRIAGYLTNADGDVISNEIISVTNSLDEVMVFRTGSLGYFSAELLPGNYTLSANVFGYEPLDVANVSVAVNGTTTQDMLVTALPAGSVNGTVSDVGTGKRLTATVHVVGTPITVTASTIDLSLPAGNYDLKVMHTGHKLEWVNISVPVDSTIVFEVNLEPREKILLVDSGHWYYDSYGQYYRDSLEELDYSYDQWRVYRPDEEGLTGDFLLNYDRVIWTAPSDAPTLINASVPISRFLGLGGDLVISGRNVGFYEGFLSGGSYWWRNFLQGVAEGQLDPAGTLSVTGVGTFDGVSLLLNGEDSAQNQVGFDFVRPLNESFTEEILQYEDSKGAGLLAGHCANGPFNIAYLAFGLEGVDGQANRTDILARSFDYFARSPRPAGVILTPDPIDNLVFSGQRLTYTLSLINESEVVTDTINLAAIGNEWSVSFITPTLTIGKCGRAETQMVIEVPAGLPRDTIHAFDVVATSTVDPAQTDQFNVSQKTPGRILFVDDDLFYDEEGAYLAALDEMGVVYDVWDTDWKNGFDRNPPAALLENYDIILWYTGYDWFRPISAVQADALYDYMGTGGRLFLSSQDYLYYNDEHPLTRDYFGVLDFQESLTPTLVFGGDNALVGEIDAQPLTYSPYQNFSDALTPSPNSEVFVWHNGGGGAGGVAQSGSDWRTLFWIFPFEKLPYKPRLDVMNQIMGWLGDLGGSSLVAEKRTVGLGELQTYTITIRHEADGSPGRVAITNTLPTEFTLVNGSITGGAVYDFANHRLLWEGDVPHGGTHIITYEAAVTGFARPGARFDNTVTYYEERHNFHFEQIVPVWLDTPDLTRSTISIPPTLQSPNRVTTVTAYLENSGDVSGTISATLHFPLASTSLSNTLTATNGRVIWDTFDVHWVGDLAPGRGVTVSIALTVPFQSMIRWFPITLVINDGQTYPLVRQTLFEWQPIFTYYPLIGKP